MNDQKAFALHQTGFAKTWMVLFVGVLASAAFVYGLLVARYEIFPYQLIYRTYSLLKNDGDTNPVAKIRSLHLTLKIRPVEHDLSLVGRGGGISRYNDVVVGVDAAGRFFFLDGDRLRPLDIKANLNRDAALAYIKENAKDELKQDGMDAFRTFDLEIRQLGDSADIYLTHHYWDAERVAKISRVSRLRVQDFPALIEDSASSYGADDWELVYECEPAIAFSDAYPSPFLSNHSGGRVAFGPDGGIYVSFGDHRFDGVSDSLIAPQEDGTCFGKIFRIDSDSLVATEVARGLRNPQGLAFDAEGRLWETEHGPHGGDEFNLIKAGENYGWPYNTHGSSYDGRRKWPLSIEPGRHEQFPPPVYAWLPSVGASAILQVGEQPAEWRGDLLMGSLKAGALHRLRTRNGRVMFEERIVIGERVRDLVQRDDGRFFVWTDTPRLLELRTVDKTDGLKLPVPLTAEEEQNEIGDILATCYSCHALGPGETNNLAPSLWGVYGRSIADAGFPGYSQSLETIDGNWTYESLAQFLESPQGFAAGTTMGAPVPMSDDTRQLLIGYLKRLK